MTVRKLGITVMPEYIQSEGRARVLENLGDLAGARSVTTSPYVAEKAQPGFGHREPPDDAGKGGHRLLDRPLWGAREVWMDTAPSFRPDPGLYEGLVYRPPKVSDLTDSAGAEISAFLDAAGARGMETWLQIQAAIPPCHRVQFGNPVEGDHPLLPDGTTGAGRVDRNVSLASPHLRAYMRAFVTDVCRAYPQAGGIKFDWPEYPVYTFESLFFDFNPSVAAFARTHGFDLGEIATGVRAFLADLAEPDTRARTLALDDLASFLASLQHAYPAIGQMMALKTALVEDYAQFLRETLDAASGGQKRLFLQCFPPPLNRATGFDLTRAGAVADFVGVKFYTMHWPLIEADYVAALQSRMTLGPDTIARVLTRFLALGPGSARALSEIRYPEPDEPHPAPSDTLAAKIATACSESLSAQIVPISHGYGPLDDVIRRFKAVTGPGVREVHVNRYCYLSDAKLDALGALMLEQA